MERGRESMGSGMVCVRGGWFRVGLGWVMGWGGGWVGKVWVGRVCVCGFGV